MGTGKSGSMVHKGVTLKVQYLWLRWLPVSCSVKEKIHKGNGLNSGKRLPLKMDLPLEGSDIRVVPLGNRIGSRSVLCLSLSINKRIVFFLLCKNK